MSVFRTKLLPVIQNYKIILRKNFPLKEANVKIKELNLKRKQLQFSSDLDLYNTGLKIIQDIEQNLTWHDKSLDFKQYLADILNRFMVKNNHIVHPRQSAARALFEIIQLVRFPAANAECKKIDRYIKIIDQYGTSEQQDKLHSILKNYQLHRSI